MQKLIKNWIFTLIVCILLSVLSVLMFLDGAGVGDLYIGKGIIHILTAVVLLLYVIFALFPLVPRYTHGGVRAFLILEIAVLLVTVVAQMFNAAFTIPFFSTMQACSVVGLALWLHSSMHLIRAYIIKGLKDHKQVPLWLFCAYIVAGSLGVWQIVDPLIDNKYFIFAIGGLALVFAVIFAVFTVQNHKALPKKSKKEKKNAETDAVAAAPTMAELAAELVQEKPESAVVPADEKKE